MPPEELIQLRYILNPRRYSGSKVFCTTSCHNNREITLQILVSLTTFGIT